MQMSLLRAATKTKRRRRRPSATTSHWLMLLLPLLMLLWLAGAMAHVVISDCDSPPTVMRAVRGAQYITPGTTTRRSTGRSRSLWSSSAINKSSNRATTAHLPDNGRTSSKLPPRATRRMRWSCRMPRGFSRASMTTQTLTLASMRAASSSTSCTTSPGTSVWRCQSGSTSLTAPRTW
jgi:hypothetical protein